MTLSNRSVGQGATLIAIAVLLAIAFGAIHVPNVADATSPLLIHGELVLMLGGVAAARGRGVFRVGRVGSDTDRLRRDRRGDRGVRAQSAARLSGIGPLCGTGDGRPRP